MPASHTTDSRGYLATRFAGFSGYLISPENGHGFLSVRHSASEDPWSDVDVHKHSLSDEFYLLLHGQLYLLIDGLTYTLLTREMLCVKSGVPHAILGGVGPVEHFGFRAPSADDRVSLGKVPEPADPGTGQSSRELTAAWGYRIALDDPANRNCWLIGLGAATHHCPHFLFAYLDFRTHEEANAGIGTRLRFHMHRQSWEYYACLQGSKTLEVEGEQVVVGAGEMAEVRPGAKHNVISREAPYVGMTFRVPILDDKVEF